MPLVQAPGSVNQAMRTRLLLEAIDTVSSCHGQDGKAMTCCMGGAACVNLMVTYGGHSTNWQHAALLQHIDADRRRARVSQAS